MEANTALSHHPWVKRSREARLLVRRRSMVWYEKCKVEEGFNLKQVLGFWELMILSGNGVPLRFDKDESSIEIEMN